MGGQCRSHTTGSVDSLAPSGVSSSIDLPPRGPLGTTQHTAVGGCVDMCKYASCLCWCRILVYASLCMYLNDVYSIYGKKCFLQTILYIFTETGFGFSCGTGFERFSRVVFDVGPSPVGLRTFTRPNPARCRKETVFIHTIYVYKSWYIFIKYCNIYVCK